MDAGAIDGDLQRPSASRRWQHCAICHLQCYIYICQMFQNYHTIRQSTLGEVHRVHWQLHTLPILILNLPLFVNTYLNLELCSHVLKKSDHIRNNIVEFSKNILVTLTTVSSSTFSIRIFLEEKLELGPCARAAAAATRGGHSKLIARRLLQRTKLIIMALCLTTGGN